jgi:hypothetical protein
MLASKRRLLASVSPLVAHDKQCRTIARTPKMSAIRSATMRCVQFWQTENSRRLDRSCGRRYRRTVPHVVDASGLCPLIQREQCANNPQPHGRNSLVGQFRLTDHQLGLAGSDQKSSRLSRCLRTVITKHPPSRILERGLPMEGPETNNCDGSATTLWAIFSRPVGGGNIERSPAFSHISRAR